MFIEVLILLVILFMFIGLLFAGYVYIGILIDMYRMKEWGFLALDMIIGLIMICIAVAFIETVIM